MEQQLKTVIISQYKASLQMLGDALDVCEDDLWETPKYHNQFWQIAYHTLFFTDMYLSDSENSFVPWKKHRDDLQNLRQMFTVEGVAISVPYKKEELLGYLEICMGKIERAMFHMNSTSPSGFHWLPFSKLELQLYNIRQIQHHTAQLIDRIRETYGKNVIWRGWN